MSCSFSAFQAITAAWRQHATGHIEKKYPVVLLKKSRDISATTVSMADTWAECSGVPRSKLYKVIVINLTFLGANFDKRVPELIPLIKDRLLEDPERSCAIVVAPNTGTYRNTYDEDFAEKCRRELLNNLRDESLELVVKDCAAFFDPKTMWSKSRRLKHEFYFCVSAKRAAEGKLRSEFCKSWLFVRESLSDWVACHPRHEFVDPTVRIAFERGNLSHMRGRMQWITGDSFYGLLVRDLWEGMPTSFQEAACWFDLTGYDHFLLNTLIKRSGVQDSSAPLEMCGTIVCGYDNEDGKCVESFLQRKVLTLLRTACEEKKYVIAGAPDLSRAVGDLQATHVKPSYKDTDFVITKPLADDSLPIRQEILEKWEGSGVPESIKDAFKTELVQHNTEYNKSGRSWSDTLKRPPAEKAVGDDAVEAHPGEGDPKSFDEIQKLHSHICETNFEDDKFKLYSSTDGVTYLLALSDTIVPATKPLASISGEYLVGQHYDKALNDGADMFNWNMQDDEYVSAFTCDTQFKTTFPTEPRPLYQFLQYLETEGNISTTVECHNVKRTGSAAAGSKDRRSKYEVSPKEKCGFRVRAAKADKPVAFAGITPSAVSESPYLRLVMRLKFVKEEKSIQPQRLGIYLSKALRVREGTLLKLIG